MRLNAGYLLDLPREIGGNFGLSRLEWRYLVGFVGSVFQGTKENEKCQNEKRLLKNKLSKHPSTEESIVLSRRLLKKRMSIWTSPIKLNPLLIL